MKRSIKISISENESFLKNLVKRSTDGRHKERLQFLYWLKTGQVKTLKEGSQLLGRSRNTLSDWLNKYESGGLETLLERKSPPGRQGPLSKEVESALKKRLADSNGFNSYWEIQTWLKENHGYDLPYYTVFRICHDKFGASPKVPRPWNVEQDIDQLETFKKNFKHNQKIK